MQRNNIKRCFILLILIFSFILYSADYKDEINKYVAIGDSLTAGLQNGSLMENFQKYSFPNILANQLEINDFEQPLISEPGIPPVMELIGLNPVQFRTASETGVPVNLTLDRPYDNLGIPGATLYSSLYPEYTGDSFYDLILRELGNSITQAISLEPDLITFWLGNNEILGGVIEGKYIEGETVFPADNYSQLLNKAIKDLSETEAKILILNIPDITIIPFVNYMSIYITNPNTGRLIRDENGNPIPYIGPQGYLSEEWYVTLNAIDYLNQGYGIPKALGGNGNPLPDEVTLSPAEIGLFQELVVEYNGIISEIAEKYEVETCDVNSFFNELSENGYIIGGVTLTCDYITGGLFSYDGIHPTSIAYSILANKIIQALNEKYDYQIPEFSFEEFFN